MIVGVDTVITHGKALGQLHLPEFSAAWGCIVPPSTGLTYNLSDHKV
jgi:hypothetical protein